MWIFAQSHFLSYHFSGLASFDVLFLSSCSTFESQRLSEFSHPVHVFLVANKNLSIKSICWKNIQHLQKKLGCQNYSKNHITGTMSHHCAHPSEDTPAGSSEALGVELPACYSAAFSCVPVSITYYSSVLGRSIWLSKPWWHMYTQSAWAGGNDGLSSQCLW